jgi:hypothetical protein
MAACLHRLFEAQTPIGRRRRSIKQASSRAKAVVPAEARPCACTATAVSDTVARNAHAHGNNAIVG